MAENNNDTALYMREWFQDWLDRAQQFFNEIRDRETPAHLDEVRSEIAFYEAILRVIDGEDSGAVPLVHPTDPVMATTLDCVGNSLRRAQEDLAAEATRPVPLGRKRFEDLEALLLRVSAYLNRVNGDAQAHG